MNDIDGHRAACMRLIGALLEMASTRYEVQLIGVGGVTSRGAFLIDEEADDDLCRVVLQYPAGELVATADDYFEALCMIREQLEGLGFRPRCRGSDRSVYPSGMSRNMGGRGIRAYKLRMGHPAKTTDLVNVFEDDPSLMPVTVLEQRRFFEEWLQGSRMTNPRP